MSTIHIHPTATSKARIKSLQARTGLVAVITGKTAQLVNLNRFSNHHAPKAATRHAFLAAVPNGDGPSAA